ncbi:MAG: STAS domain-containing protein [Clostridia bacterium]|nr:STAS domain-containing protein [Clostridia bacterium]
MRKNCVFEASRSGEVLELTLRGEIDHHSAVGIRTEMDERIREEHPRKTVLDLSGIDFMDSSGLGLIMGRFALMERLGGELTLKNPNERLMKIFELAGLERMIRIECDAKKEEEQ